MKTTLFFLLALFPLCSNAFVEWPFKIDEFRNLIFNLQVGTPSQTIKLGTFHLGFYVLLQLPDKTTDGGDLEFDYTKSSTFVSLGEGHFQGNMTGIMGTDTLIIGDKLVVKKSHPFGLITKHWFFPGMGIFALTRSNDSSQGFIEGVLEDQKEKVVVLTYDKWSDPSKSVGLTGTFNIGGRPTKKCSSKWTRFNETTYTDRPLEQWTVNIKKIQAGKFSSSSPGQISFQLNDEGLGMPNSTYDSVMKALGSTNKKTIPCNANADIKIILEHEFEFKISAKDYLVKGKDETCTLRANRLPEGVKGFIFPIYFFRDYCLLLDYKNKQIGLAERTF